MENKTISPNTDLNDLVNDGKIDKPVEFQTQIRKALYKNILLKQVLEFYESNYDEFSKKYIDEDEEDEKTNDDEKIVIILEVLLEILDVLDLGIGIENYFICLYNKSHWEEVHETILKTFLIEVAIKSRIKPSKARKRRFVDALFNQFIISAALVIDDKKHDKVKINLLNGTLSIDKKGNVSLGEHKRGDYFKYQLSFNYDPLAKAPLFEKFLNEVLPDKQSQLVLLEYCAYIFTTNLKLEKILILYGSGANGKSVFFEVLTALIGEANVSYFSMERLCDENGYYRAKLSSKLLNYASEFGKINDIQMFKKLISGEPVEARLPHKEPISVSNYGKFIFNANKLPEVEHTDAFFRRLFIIHFKNTISDSKKDINLSKKIIDSELSGILNLLLLGLNRLISQNGFSKSESIDEGMRTYRKDNNSVSLFLEEENWVHSNNNKTLLKDIYELYKDYCRESNQKPFGRPNFSRRLKELNFVFESGTNNYTFVWVEKKSDVMSLDPFSEFTKDILK